jgi:hypothetical protein
LLPTKESKSTVATREVLLSLSLADQVEIKVSKMYLFTHYMALKQPSFFPQNGICINKYHFGSKNDPEKWSRKNVLKLLHPGIYFHILHKIPKITNSVKKNNHFPSWRDFKIIFSRPLFTIIFRTKIGCRFHFEGKNDVCFTAIQCV